MWFFEEDLYHKCALLFSHVQLFVTPRTVVCARLLCIKSQSFQVWSPCFSMADRRLCPSPYQRASFKILYSCHLWVDLYSSVGYVRDRPWIICSKWKLSGDNGREGKTWSMKTCLIFSRAFLFKNSFDLSIFKLSLERKVFQDIVELKYPLIIFTAQRKQKLLIVTCHTVYRPSGCLKWHSESLEN